MLKKPLIKNVSIMKKAMIPKNLRNSLSLAVIAHLENLGNIEIGSENGTSRNIPFYNSIIK